MKKINGRYYTIISRYLLDEAVKTDGVVQCTFDIYFVRGGLVVSDFPTREDAEQYLTELENETK